jgi:hypothetical protein
MSRCRSFIVQLLRKEADLVNARQVSTLFQEEIIALGRLLYCADKFTVDGFGQNAVIATGHDVSVVFVGCAR